MREVFFEKPTLSQEDAVGAARKLMGELQLALQGSREATDASVTHFIGEYDRETMRYEKRGQKISVVRFQPGEIRVDAVRLVEGDGKIVFSRKSLGLDVRTPGPTKVGYAVEWFNYAEQREGEDVRSRGVHAINTPRAVNRVRRFLDSL
ncbi:hypothetical protein KKD61_04215 [Patescibacteria group bacterium]|nr:hypothetical protein [Patescibacteria group bacterium]